MSKHFESQEEYEKSLLEKYIKGDKGDKGDRGEKGDKGPQGIQGIQGKSGKDGKDGKSGKDGKKGEKGDRGDKGDKGEPGKDASPSETLDPVVLKEDILTEVDNSFASKFEENINILGMPDFRKLAMGLQGQIDAIDPSPSIGGTITGGEDNHVLYVNPAGVIDQSDNFTFQDDDFNGLLVNSNVSVRNPFYAGFYSQAVGPGGEFSFGTQYLEVNNASLSTAAIYWYNIESGLEILRYNGSTQVLYLTNISTEDVIPKTNTAFNLGDGTHFWADLYIDGVLRNSANDQVTVEQLYDTYQTVVAGVVPYTGATDDVDLGANDLLAADITLTGVLKTRATTVSDATSITPNSATTTLVIQANTQAAGTLTMNAPTGSPYQGQALVIRIKSTNIQTFAWNAIYRAVSSNSLPTYTTGGTTTDYISFIYNSTDTKWDFTGSTL